MLLIKYLIIFLKFYFIRSLKALYEMIMISLINFISMIHKVKCLWLFSLLIFLFLIYWSIKIPEYRLSTIRRAANPLKWQSGTEECLSFLLGNNLINSSVSKICADCVSHCMTDQLLIYNLFSSDWFIQSWISHDSVVTELLSLFVSRFSSSDHIIVIETSTTWSHSGTRCFHFVSSAFSKNMRYCCGYERITQPSAKIGVFKANLF